MAAVCSYFKYGFCKNGNSCRRSHIMETCEIEHCDGLDCEKRHPRTCRYYQQYKRCKFGELCAYKHSNPSVDPVIQELAALRTKFNEIENEIKRKNYEILTLLRRLNGSSGSTLKLTTENIDEDASLTPSCITQNLTNLTSSPTESITTAGTTHCEQGPFTAPSEPQPLSKDEQNSQLGQHGRLQ